jgi:two-component system NarL family response regulator
MRVLIADDHKLIAEGIKRSLQDERDFEIVAEVSNGAQILPLVRRTSPDLVLLDLRMPGSDGLSTLEAIRQQHPDIKVVVLSASADPSVVNAALARGAAAFITKGVNPADLAATLRQVLAGNVYHPVVLGPDEQSGAAELGLTTRELSILSALARGLPNGAIARELFVAEQTVKFHLTNIYRKLDATNRTEAVRIAYQRGVIENPLFEAASHG